MSTTSEWQYLDPYAHMAFRHYVSEEGYETFECRRRGIDPVKSQLKELQKLMSALVADNGAGIDATLIVERRPWP
jgi:hypothetical protein